MGRSDKQVADGRKLRELSERLEPLLDEVRSMASPPVWERVEEIVRSVVQLYGEGLKRIDEIAAADGTAGERLRSQLAADDLVSSLLILHGLHPKDFETRVREALERVRPYLGSHGGDVEIAELSAETGLVRLRMKGSCDGCPSSLLTVKLAVEGAIRESAPDASKIEVEGVTDPPAAAAPKSPREPSLEIEPTWVSIGDHNGFPASLLTSTEAMGSRIVLCRVEGRLYAYRDSCPACGSAMGGGNVTGSLMVCPSCDRNYDPRLAGRSTESRGLHLEPVPLLEDQDGVRVAIASPLMS
jgi:Fe-S cluster biogenesis protein NfuA/nitrite reductase/ring-hydroxylating ferredoxin subunit